MQDIRLFNTDRHAGNMLVRTSKDTMGSSVNLLSRMSDSQYELVPIDHGFCLPESLDAPYFEWLHWPQAMLPFSEEELEYIEKLDIEVGNWWALECSGIKTRYCYMYEASSYSFFV